MKPKNVSENEIIDKKENHLVQENIVKNNLEGNEKKPAQITKMKYIRKDH
jgi:hypothetical protein